MLDDRDCIHIFANPLDNSVCPILALALHIFTRGWNINMTSVFKSSTQMADLFSVRLSYLKNNNEEIKACNGIMNRNIGTHSFRKGCSTMTGNIVAGPTVFSVASRANWKKMEPEKRYIALEHGGTHI